MTKTATTLDDKYLQETGRVLLSSNQALVRLPLDQSRRDAARGMKTAGYISGYRGSPLGVYDAALWAAQKHLDAHAIMFEPGLNEELAATAIRGTQQLAWFGKSDYEGIFGLWYGKGLGLDRANEALKLGNMEGSSATGGFLVVAGDDHGGKSSATAHQSEHALIASLIPTLYPATTGEMLEYGMFGWEMSRCSGAYVGLKCITDTLDLTASVELPDIHRVYSKPDDMTMPPDGLNLIKGMTPLRMEEMLVNYRLPAAEAFARVNRIDRTPIDGERRVLGLVAAGKAYLDLRQAMVDLGLSEEKCRALGIRLYKPGLIWPMEREGALAFASGHRALLVVEEKRPVMEDQLARYFYALDADRRPAILGKQDLAGKPMLPAIGELNPQLVRRALRDALVQIGIEDEDVEKRFAYFHDLEGQAILIGGGGKYRPAFYCSGCPHNTSTKIPDGSIAIAAVGCQGLAAYVMPERRTMLPVGMGSDGMPWVSVGKFVEMPHVFQNMGDGTYSHSGILAIRAAVAAKANMTFKILFNDAVAMTGGQPVEMHISPIDMLNQLVSEQVSPVLLVSDDPEKYARSKLPEGVEVFDRDMMDMLQRRLRTQKGVSAIVYEQTCATEKRRRRKRGSYPDPDKRVFINQDVCEGCGDCSVKSNCVSITPLETEFGRKRAIDQSTCNKDFSCVKGFCPSFVTVQGAKIATHVSGDAARIDAMIAALPTPEIHVLGEECYNILVGGIGGTGVLTVGAILGMAAHLEGKGCSVLDLTGMAQKGGAVTSHIRIGHSPETIYAARLGIGATDVILACDMIVGSGADVLKSIRPGHTAAVVNQDVTPTGEFQTNRNLDLGEEAMEATILKALRGGAYLPFHASRLATDLIGDSIATNIMMVGYAAQKGLLPVSVASIEEAIKLNGTFVKGNLRTFALGRLAAYDPGGLAREIGAATELPRLDTVDAVLESRGHLLADYQNQAYADGYASFVRDMERRIAARGLEGGDLLVRDIALTLGRIMAYKDEYEVARLHSDPKFWDRLNRQFNGDFKVTFHLAPPMLPGKDQDGKPRKREFGGWMLPVFRALARLKGLRGTAFDPFGYTAERRFERKLIEDYRALMADVIDRVDQRTLPVALELASAAYDIRGYGHVKEESIAEYEKRIGELRAAFCAPPEIAAADPVPTLVG
ncbi:indolepyruvate ferredoxin oxidoreductase family protein [Rhizorhapis suberifaciens]|uniref:Indolepyruvate ferredoxin oxidoreductase n=1 Tax=Rhizorhapis suberifaciens TaxID=13656 RepID=A0A840HTD4_9SPHN|nr:indolepyruvate ferredoxin oxidoreductase family protein [Rhizorhapis suberifaciens]MBB4641432.1 indolepyruvate ferredoxin oxidoreductase [Rhizorhapis suberifaciens]